MINFTENQLRKSSSKKYEESLKETKIVEI